MLILISVDPVVSMIGLSDDHEDEEDNGGECATSFRSLSDHTDRCLQAINRREVARGPGQAGRRYTLPQKR